jgi:hypothetical protein
VSWGISDTLPVCYYYRQRQRSLRRRVIHTPCDTVWILRGHHQIERREDMPAEYVIATLTR